MEEVGREWEIQFRVRYLDGKAMQGRDGVMDWMVLVHEMSSQLSFSLFFPLRHVIHLQHRSLHFNPASS